MVASVADLSEGKLLIFGIFGAWDTRSMEIVLVLPSSSIVTVSYWTLITRGGSSVRSRSLL